MIWDRPQILPHGAERNRRLLDPALTLANESRHVPDLISIDLIDKQDERMFNEGIELFFEGNCSGRPVGLREARHGRVALEGHQQGLIGIDGLLA